MAMTELEQHYNKFNEEKRLDSRHGRVEFITSMKYIHNCLDDIKALEYIRLSRLLEELVHLFRLQDLRTV